MRCQSFHDTLQFYKDSIVFNRYLFESSASKFIQYNDTIYEIKKCAYNRQESLPVEYANYYININLGIIYSTHISQSSGAIKYGTDPKSVYIKNAIIQHNEFPTFK